jgi:iron-sulfur cluster repair protein YtfE (RIC family)
MAQRNSQPPTGQPGTPGEALLRELQMVHDMVRHDLAVCRALADEVAAGVAPEQVHARITSLRTSGPLWKLRVNCLYYCRVVHTHHRIEDATLFPAVRRTNPELGPVVDRLEADHKRVSHLLDEVEDGAEALENHDDTAARTRLVAALNDLAGDLLAHLEFEEEAIGSALLAWKAWLL